MTTARTTASTGCTSPGPLSRRRFLKAATITGVGLTILPGGALAGPNAPSNKLGVAIIGAGGRGRKHFGAVENENVVALCDVDEQTLATAAETFPDAKHYVDWYGDCLFSHNFLTCLCVYFHYNTVFTERICF